MMTDQNSRKHFTLSTEIVSSGYAYPSDIVDNDAFFSRCRFPITNDRAALERETRMKTRRWCLPEENTWTMAKSAVEMALASGPVGRDEIDLVVVSSCSTIPTVNYPDPANPIMADLALRVLKELGRDDATGMDIKGTYCAGFIRGLELMDSMLENPNYRAGLLVGTDVGGMFATAESNRSPFCFVIADSAGAVVLRKRAPAPRVGLLDYGGVTAASFSDVMGWGKDGRSIVVRGTRVQPVGMELLLSTGRRLLERNRLTPADIDWLLPAQTHVATVEALCDGLGIAREKLLWFGDVNGYSASASIPTCLAEQLHKGTIRKGDLVLSLAIGAGLNCAGALYYC
jgi:3-oxoacyl-[acyl-carrier-protein] synthase III